jgi:transposase
MIAAVVERCAGIDIGKKFLKVCVMTGPLSEDPKFEIRRVECTQTGYEQLQQWLQSEAVTKVVMESTGPYWVPVFNVLEKSVAVVLANPTEVKNRKGHKTDAKDAWWLAHLLRHGMIRPSFIPEIHTRELRELTRRRKKLIGMVAQERNRVQKQLEYGNVKLGNELSDVFGLSGQLMLKALVDEDRTPEEIAELAQGSAQKKKAEIIEAVRGRRLTAMQKELIRSSMRHMVFLELEIRQVDELIGGLIETAAQQKQYQLLQTIPGIKQEAAGSVLAEIGPDMKQFPDAGRLSSWGGLCPGNNESAGKNKSRHTTHGNPWFRATMLECAWSASRTNGSAFQATYRRLKPKIGHKRAIVAVAHALVRAIYYVMASGEAYRQAAREELTDAKRQRIVRHHTRRLRRLGCWLKQEELSPLKEWYVTHCVPSLEPEPPKRRGRKPKANGAEGGAAAAPGADAPKRRGTKPKVTPAQAQGANPEMPKKRGRKPKKVEATGEVSHTESPE